MITINKLFFRRLREEWKLRIRTLKILADWTVVLYILAPFFVAFGYEYISWWKQTPSWIKEVPIFVIWGLGLFFASIGSMRMFIQEGDQLFLLQHAKWIKGLKIRGFLYSLISFSLQTVFVVCILSPLFTLNYHYTLEQIFSFGLFILLAKLMFSQMKLFIQDHISSISRNILYFIIVAMSVSIVCFTQVYNHLSILLLIDMGLLVGSLLLMYKKLNRGRTFFIDVSYEQQMSMKMFSFIIKMDGLQEKKNILGKNRPFFFRHSNVLFQERSKRNIIMEIMLKTIFRNSMYLRDYFQMTAVYTVAILVVPIWLKWILWFLFGVIFVIYGNSFFKRVLSSEFMSRYRWPQSCALEAKKKFIQWFILPSFLIFGIAVGVSYSLGGVLFMLLLSWFVRLMIIRLFFYLESKGLVR